LLGSMPTLDSDEEELFAIPGSPPDMLNPPKGDAFAPRNEFALEIDTVMEPPMFKVSDTHYAATWLLHEDAPKIEPPASVKRRMQGFASTASKDGEA
ncbi:ABC transporter ATP-binding protein, partial [Virgibacillus sp. M23]|nr:ABC transporter ATP-binding protein [Virgibacillus sp. M23]